MDSAPKRRRLEALLERNIRPVLFQQALADLEKKLLRTESDLSRQTQRAIKAEEKVEVLEKEILVATDQVKEAERRSIEMILHAGRNAEDLQIQTQRAIKAEKLVELLKKKNLVAEERAAAAERRAIQMIEQAEMRAKIVEESTSASSSSSAASSSQNDWPTCPVCLETIYDESAWILPCGHSLHRACQKGLVRSRHKRCPTCRDAFR